MKTLSYRNDKNAQAISAYWGKALDKPDWFSINALSGNEPEILIYSVIGWPFTDIEGLVRAIASERNKHFLARINSPGGDCFDGMSLYNAFANHPGGVTVRIEGLAASMASIVAMAGQKVEAYQNTTFMIHNAWVCTAGDHNVIREIADISQAISEQMRDIYTGKTKTGKKEMQKMMDDETYMTAKEAKERGFIDTIIDGKAAKAQFDLSMFAHVPDGFQSETNKPTEREIEKALRDVGLSKKEAKALLAGRLQDTDGADEEVLAAQNLLNKIGGK